LNDTFFSIVNSGLLYILVGIVILFVVILSLLFAKKAWSRALQLGYTKSQLMTVIKSTSIATIVPSLAIVIGLFALAPVLGNPWPWLRLSVLGSVTYELMAADMAASSMGVALTELPTVGIDAFVNIMFVMTVGISAGLFVLLFFGEKIQNGIGSMGKNKQSFGIVALECFMIGLLATFLPAFFTKGFVSVLTFFTSTAITITMGLFVLKYNIKWLKDFILAFALIGGMASSVLWTGLLG